MRTSRVLGFVFSALAFSACARTEELPHGGETNWLRACSDDTDCAVGSCLCGVCTTTCEGAGDCDGAYVGSCIDAESRIGVLACDGPARVAAVCLPACIGDRDCGDGFACREGTCVTSEVAAKVDRPDIEVVKDGCKLQPCAEMTSASCSGLDMARRLVSPCFVPGLTPFYEAQCGGYQAIVAQGTDSAVVHYYDAAGKAKGQSENGLGASSCKAYEPGFRPQDCEIVTPNCSAVEEPPLAMDGGPPEPRDASMRADAGPVGDAAAATCTVAVRPLCEPFDDPLCALDTARKLVPACRMPFVTPYHEVRCGQYTGIVVQGIDSRNTFLYDAGGNVVARNDEGGDGRRCTAGEPSFSFPPCTMVTPDCPDP